MTHKDQAATDHAPMEPEVVPGMFMCGLVAARAVSGSLGLVGPRHEQNLEAAESQLSSLAGELLDARDYYTDGHADSKPMRPGAHATDPADSWNVNSSPPPAQPQTIPSLCLNCFQVTYS